MIRRRLRAVLMATTMAVAALLCAPGLIPGGARADVDALEDRLSGGTAPLLRWDNVEGAPLWAGGERPVRDRGTGLHAVTLAPGASVTVRLPADGALRLRRPEGAALEREAVEVSLSDGSGLAVLQDPQRSIDGRDLLVRGPTDAPAIARVRNPAGNGGPLALALFVSRQEPPNLALYRDRLDLDAPDATLTRRMQSLAHDRLTPNVEAAAEVQGPARLALRTRALFAEGGAVWTLSYRIAVRLDGADWRTLSFETTPDLSEPFRLDGAPQAVGLERIGYLDVPTGTHRLAFDASAPVAVRVLAGGVAGYLLPGLNAPELTSADSPFDPAALEAQARRLARDNRWGGAGLAASALMERSAKERPGDPAVQRAAERLRGSYTEYRELLPQRLPKGLRPGNGWVAEDRLIGPFDPPRPPDPAGLGPELLQDRLLGASFLPVPERSAPFRYVLPAREAPSQLRLIAAREGLDRSVDLFVQYDGAPPRRVRLHPGRDLPPNAYQPGPGRLGLRDQEGSVVPTQDGAFAVNHPPGPLVEAGTAELPLPRGVRTVTLWREQGGPPVRVAVQYRASRPEPLASGAQMEETARLGQPDAYRLFTGAVAAAITCPSWTEQPDRCAFLRDLDRRPEAARELHNGWLPLLRLLRARHRTAFATVEKPSGGGTTVGQARMLERQGEHYLAERVLKGLYRDARSPQARRQAFDDLMRRYRETNDLEGQEAMLAAEIARRPDLTLLRALADALMADRRDAMALQVGLAMPPGERPADLPQAAYRLGWWPEYEVLAGADPDPARRLVWQGLEAQRHGEEERALALFRQAGPAGSPWAKALEDGRAIRAAPSADAWLAWQAAHPGPRLWEDASPLVTGHAGAATVVSTARDLPFAAFLTLPGNPVRLSVPGPATLRVEARPLHPSAKGAPANGWFRIRAGGTITGGAARPVSYTNNVPAAGLEALGAPGVPGTAVVEPLTLPAGVSEVAVETDGTPLLVRVAVERPALPLAVLPPATQGTLAAFGASAPQAGGAAAPAAPGEAVRARLDRLLAAFERAPERNGAALAEAARLAQENAAVPGVPAVWGRFTRKARWERLASPESSAGVRTVPVEGWEPESPAVQARAALLKPLGPAEQLLGGTATVAVSIINTAAGEVEARLSPVTLPTMPAEPVEVRWWLDDGAPATLRVGPGRAPQTLRIPVPAGEHALRFALVNPVANRFVRLGLWERAPDGSMVPLAKRADRAYDVATAAEPLVHRIEGPAWLRIDELRDGNTLTRYRPVPAGWQAVDLRPEPGREEALLRVFRLVPDPTVVASDVEPLAPAPERTPDPPVTVADAPDIRGVRFDDGLPLGGQEDGTWSVTALVQRRLANDEPQTGTKPQPSAELSAVHRYFDPARQLYWRTEFLARGWDLDRPTLGFTERVEHRPVDLPLVLRAGADLYGQRLPERGVEWSGTLQAGAAFRQELSEKTGHRMGATVFVRHLSLSQEEARGLGDIDPDVFTPYKATHRHGLRFSYSLTHSPWLDTRWVLNAGLTTTQSFNPLQPDNVALEVAWQQLFGPVVAEIGYRQARYFANGGRSAPLNDNRLRLGASYDHFLPSGERVELGFGVEKRLRTGDVTGLVSVTWHFGNGRGYRDFMPGEVPFDDIRGRRLFALSNNNVWANDGVRDVGPD
ncbi:hypothetical protein [Azospirillum sp. sgz302134]